MKTKEEFLKLISDKQKSYDFSLIPNEFTTKTRLEIICHEKDELGREHGVFTTTYDHFIKRGDGCPKCSGKYMDKELFVYLSKQIHGNETYNYDKFNFKDKNTESIIHCNIHNHDFKQKAKKHLLGHGCPICRYEKSGAAKRKSNDTFVKEIEQIHPNKDEYEILGTYVTEKIPIEIFCKKLDKNGNVHGIFKNTPNRFLNKCLLEWCPKCGRERTIKAKTYTTEQWIEIARKKHNDEYVYDEKLNYVDGKHKVNILCRKHGYYPMLPTNHLFGQGCPICNASKLEKEINVFLTENKIEFEQQKRFDWLGRQSLDFYLPQYNVAIECQGKQHFDLGGWNEPLELIKQRDERKRKLCEEKGIKLLYYSNLGIDYPYEVYEDKTKLLTEIIKC